MTAFPSSRGRRVCGCAVALALLAAALPGQAAPADVPPPGAPVAVDALPPIAVDAVGWPDAARALDRNVWRGTSRDAVVERLRALPIAAASPTLQALQMRLMTAAADPPPATADQPAGAFLVARLLVLLRAGAWEPVIELVQRTPADSRLPAIARVDAEARFLAGDHDGACRAITAAVGQADPADAFWPRALAFCQAVTGDDAAAALSLTLLREAGADDQRFHALVGALAGAGDRPTIELDGPPEPDPLFVAAARAAGARPPAGWAETGAPWLTRVLADATGLPMGLRLVAAERAHAAGAVAAETVRTLYREAVAAQPGGSGAVATAFARAEAFRRAEAATIDLDRADAVIKALDDSRQTARYAPTADLYRDLLVSFEPTPTLISRSGELVPALLALGAVESAVVWLEVAQAESEFNSAALEAGVKAAPYIALLDPAFDDDARLTRWAALAEGDGAQRAAVLAVAFQGLGRRVPPALATAAAPAMPAVPDPGAPSEVTAAAAPSEVTAAAAAGQVGETLLGVLMLPPPEGPGRWDVSTVAAAVAALRRVGLEHEARDLALEAATARGL